jgi:hypothetical protein
VGPKGVRAEANIRCASSLSPPPLILYFVAACSPRLLRPVVALPSHSLCRRRVRSCPSAHRRPAPCGAAFCALQSSVSPASSTLPPRSVPRRSILKRACSCVLCALPPRSTHPLHHRRPQGKTKQPWPVGCPDAGVCPNVRALVVPMENSIDSYRGAIDSENLKSFN